MIIKATMNALTDIKTAQLFKESIYRQTTSKGIKYLRLFLLILAISQMIIAYKIYLIANINST